MCRQTSQIMWDSDMWGLMTVPLQKGPVTIIHYRETGQEGLFLPRFLICLTTVISTRLHWLRSHPKAPGQMPIRSGRLSNVIRIWVKEGRTDSHRGKSTRKERKKASILLGAESNWEDVWSSKCIQCLPLQHVSVQLSDNGTQRVTCVWGCGRGF